MQAFNEIAKISADEEAALWQFMSDMTSDGTTPHSDEAKAQIIEKIKSMPVYQMHESDDGTIEHIGMVPTQELADEERFVWLSIFPASNECCIADEFGAENFDDLRT